MKCNRKNGDRILSKVVELYPYANAPKMLRQLADDMEEGKVSDENCTVIVGLNIYNFGVVDDEQAVKNAVWDMTYGIGQLTNAGREALEE